ncbi:MAG: hypothetical protein HYS59_02165, partial [Candidatus Vogelbacteria bacterium]|nr:hypothetical protein [Candidatus Vogelbacteria bacterium]
GVLKEAEEMKRAEGKESFRPEIDVEKIISELERLLEEGADKDSVARGLAGVNHDAGFEFREKFFADDPTTFAKNFATNWPFLDGVICRYGWEG